MIGPDQYCSCIESKLPKLGTHISVQAKTVDPRWLDRKKTYTLSSLITSSENRQHVIAKLKSYGLGDHEVGLLVARYYDDKTFEEITVEQYWTSKQSASYAHQLALKKLRKAGFKL